MNIKLDVMPANGDINKAARQSRSHAVKTRGHNVGFLADEITVTVKTDPARCWVKKPGESSFTAHG